MKSRLSRKFDKKSIIFVKFGNIFLNFEDINGNKMKGILGTSNATHIQNQQNHEFIECFFEKFNH